MTWVNSKIQALEGRLAKLRDKVSSLLQDKYPYVVDKTSEFKRLNNEIRLVKQEIKELMMTPEREKITFYPLKNVLAWVRDEATKYDVTVSSYVSSTLLQKYNQRNKKSNFDPRKVLPELSKGKAK